MAKLSKKQLEANRRNALKSTGPKTESGKAIVARNATKHGLCARHSVIKGEIQAEFDSFHTEIFAEYKPVGMLEIALLDKIVTAIWQQQRVSRIENDMIDKLSIPSDQRPQSKRILPFDFSITKTYADKPNERTIYGGEKIINTEILDDGTERVIESEDDADNSDNPPKDSELREAKNLSIGETFIKDIEGPNILTKFQRYAKEIDNSLYKAIKEFYWLQEKRLKQEILEAERTDE